MLPSPRQQREDLLRLVAERTREKDRLIREINHRIGNQIQVLKSMVSVENRKATAPESITTPWPRSTSSARRRTTLKPAQADLRGDQPRNRRALRRCSSASAARPLAKSGSVPGIGLKTMPSGKVIRI
jgi:Histidine kinase